MTQAGQRCLDNLTDLGVVWEKAKATKKITTPIVVPNLTFRGLVLESMWRKPPFVMDCHLAEAFALTADAFLLAGIEKLRFAGIHDYRNVRRKGVKRKMLSRHALGMAIDVYEMVTEDGEKLIVKKDYKKGSVPLHIVEKIARKSPLFRGILTPGNDPRSHHDHFHFEAAMKLSR